MVVWSFGLGADFVPKSRRGDSILRKIQPIFVRALLARGLPAWLAAGMGRSSDFDPRACRQPVTSAQN